MGQTAAYVFSTDPTAPEARRPPPLAPARVARGVYLVLPGLHYAGPDDPRLDRFCRVLAWSGFIVVAPFIRSFSALVLEPSAFDDARGALALAMTEADARGLGAPAVFSISFGSRLAIELGAEPRPPSELLLFGGYAEFAEAVRFAVTGSARGLGGERVTGAHDPLNAPVVFMNLLQNLGVSDEPALAEAWLAMVKATWGKAELKVGDARRPFADGIATGLPGALREPFLRGCGLAPGAAAWLEEGLAGARERLAFLDAREALGRVRCPVTVVHGRDDDVLPAAEAEKIAAWLPADLVRGVHLTGAYGHTGAAGVPMGRAVEEVRVMTRILAGLAAAPQRG